MKAALVINYNPFHKFKDRVVKEINDPETTINSLVESNPDLIHKTFICLKNGYPVLRKNWEDKVANDDLINFNVLPEGGVVSGVTNFFSNVIGSTLNVFGDVFGDLFGGLLGVPEVPSVNSGNNAIGSASPTYSLSAQGNSARLGESIPVLYGRMLIYPDFATETYTEYDTNNNQFLYEVLVIGQGYYDIEKIRIEDTDISNFAEISYNILNPGDAFTLVSPNVVTSNEVSGQELVGPNLGGSYIGPFIVNPPNTSCTQLAFDIELPRGMYNNTSGFNTTSVTFEFSARLIDSDGLPLGSWATLGTETLTLATIDAIRKTYKYSVTAGRYEIRARRTTNDVDTSALISEIHWTNGKGYLSDSQDFSNLTLIEIKMRATNNLSGRSSKKVNVIATRKLYTWNPMTGFSASRVATSSIAWAIVDAFKSYYGAGLNDAEIDLQGIYDLEQIWAARGDEFNGVFDRKMSFWEAIKIICRAGRASPIQQGSIHRVIRDTEQTIPTSMFTARNIVKDSFAVQFILTSQDEYDGVTLKYFDETLWRPKEISVDENGDPPLNPATVDMQLGVTNAAQAMKEALYLARNNAYRRTRISYDTELEGYIPMYGDLITISHDVPKWGISGDVTDVVDGIIELSEPVDFTNPGTYYMTFRGRDNRPSGPWEVESVVDDDYAVELVGSWSYTYDSSADFITAHNNVTGDDIRLYYGTKEEQTHFAFGIGETWSQLGLVKSLKPKGDLTVAIEIVNEDSRVHED